MAKEPAHNDSSQQGNTNPVNLDARRRVFVSADPKESTKELNDKAKKNNRLKSNESKDESKLAGREVELIEREIKILSLQQEVEQLRPVSGLYRLVRAMASERNLDSLLSLISRETKAILKCDRASLYVLDHENGELWTKHYEQSPDNEPIIVKLPLSSTSIVGLCARNAETVKIDTAYSDSRFDPECDRQSGSLTRNVLAVPMLNPGGEVLGVFEAVNKAGGPFAQEDLEWLAGLAVVAGGLIEQTKAYSEMERFMDKTLEMLARTIDKRDPLTAGHSMRVTKYSLLIAEALTIGQPNIDVLRYSAMMHDYGKIGVPESILWKNGRLTPEEYACVQQHAKFTYDLLVTLPFTKRLASVPFVASCHHEKLDGSGYYRGLKGDEIPYLTRIITVSDVFDALTSVRHYRNRMAITKVTEIMESGRDNHFDAQMVDTFYSLPADLVIKVMESERGQIQSADLDQFASLSLRRLVELCAGAKGTAEEVQLKEAFEQIYYAGLPSDYQALD